MLAFEAWVGSLTVVVICTRHVTSENSCSPRPAMSARAQDVFESACENKKYTFAHTVTQTTRAPDERVLSCNSCSRKPPDAGDILNMIAQCLMSGEDRACGPKGERYYETRVCVRVGGSTMRKQSIGAFKRYL